MCDKCNDFVFHYLLDYSCRVLSVDSVLFLVLKKPLISFNVLGCRKFVRTCSLFFAKDRAEQTFSHTVAVVHFDVLFSKLFGVCCFVCAPFYRNFCFGFRTTENVQKKNLPRARSLSLPLGQSAFPCFCELAFSIVLPASLSALGKGRNKSIVIEVGVG